MADCLTPKEWKSFQHYKERRPPWIKLHRPLLDNADFQRLPVASRALAPMLWLIAAEYENGAITASAEDIAWRLRMSMSEFNEAIKPLVEKGFFYYSQHDIEALAECKQEVLPEREGETQVQTEKDGGVKERERASEQPKATSKPKSLISEEAWRIARDVLLAMGLSEHDPKAVGAPFTVQTWLTGGWPEVAILDGVKRAMASRNGDPPSTLKYFEKAIARSHADMTRQLPVANPSEVRSNGKSRNNILDAVSARLERLSGSGSGEDDFAPDRDHVQRLSVG